MKVVLLASQGMPRGIAPSYDFLSSGKREIVFDQQCILHVWDQPFGDGIY